jgi:thioredoxin reductase
MPERDESWDVVVVGGGSAGLSAALMLVRSRRRVLVLDGGEPRNGVASHMHGVLGRDHTSPLGLLADGRREVERYGGRIEAGTIVDAVPTDGGFAVRTDDGSTQQTRRLLVATGLRDQLPDIPGVQDQWGRGVVTCPYCDGYEARDRRVAVLATAAMSVFQAQLLRQLSAEVTYFSRGMLPPSEDQRAAFAARGIKLDDRPIARVVTVDDAVVAIETVDGDRIDIAVVFIAPQPVPRDELLVRLGAARRDDGAWTAVDATGRTSVPGLFAVGNVVDPMANVPMSMGAGSAVGGALNADLVTNDIARALGHTGA